MVDAANALILCVLMGNADFSWDFEIGNDRAHHRAIAVIDMWTMEKFDIGTFFGRARLIKFQHIPRERPEFATCGSGLSIPADISFTSCLSMS